MEHLYKTCLPWQQVVSIGVRVCISSTMSLINPRSGRPSEKPGSHSPPDSSRSFGTPSPTTSHQDFRRLSGPLSSPDPKRRGQTSKLGEPGSSTSRPNPRNRKQKSETRKQKIHNTFQTDRPRTEEVLLPPPVELTRLLLLLVLLHRSYYPSGQRRISGN